MKLNPIISALLCAGFVSSATAQTLEGKVTNKKGEPLANAVIELEGTNIKSRSDEHGNFTIKNLQQGLNEIHISAPGFAHLHKDIEITGSETVEMEFALGVSPIEVLDVIASPIHLSSMESSVPVKVIGGEELRRKQAATLGDTLDSIPGVHTNFHAKVASTPIIRGLSGPRVQIAQNGLDSSDVSRVGPDHAVATESSTAQQIEVLRGPATLFYGSGAIGGVVNVVDQRVPTTNDTRGELLAELATVDEQQLISGNFITGTENIAFYADAYYRKSEDYDVPVAAEVHDQDHDGHEEEHEHSGDKFVANSGEESSGFTLGTSYLLDNGYFGVSIEEFRREYGIPGHTHDHGGHDHSDEHDHEGEHEDSEEEIFADLEQTRVQFISELAFEDSILSQLNFRVGYTDYVHAEIEEGFVGTTFENETIETRLDLLHQTVLGFNGGLSLHYRNSKVEAQGSEAFTPPSETEMFSIALLEERHLTEDVLLQFGARLERVSLTAEEVKLPNLGAHSHEEGNEHNHDAHVHGDQDHDHSHDHSDHSDEVDITRVFYADHEFTPLSLSAGLVWDFHSDYNLGVSVSRSQRAPSASELLSFGPHIGTSTYEVGALFELHEHDGESEIGLTSETIDLETSSNIDLMFRKTQGDIGFIFNLFYNEVDNYYYQLNTGLFGDDGHNHGSDDHDDHMHSDHDQGSDEHDHSGELPIFIFQTDDVVLNGFEAQVAWQVNDEFNATVFSDFVRARLQNGGNLPRTSPFRFGTNLSYKTSNYAAILEITRYQQQSRVADFETPTDGYTLVDLHVSYDLPVNGQMFSIYFKGENLTDTEARVHTSFLKDIAPRPGRNFALGVQTFF